MSNLYILVSGMVFLALALIWRTESWLNFTIRYTMFALVAWAIVILIGPSNIAALAGK